VTGLDRWYLAVLVFGRGFFTYTLERDEAEISALMEAEKLFWRCVEEDTPPTPDGSEATTDAISVAAKALGVGASVYWERDPDKYFPEPAAPQEKPKAPEYICECCGGVIAPYRDGAGKPVNLAKHAERSLEKYGKLLCLDCIAAEARTRELNNGQVLPF